ncbi:hypothetical protein KH5_17700 [Urechidicola sp. KH5]
MYAILDIETTGGKFNEEGITEIAIYKFDGHDVIDNLVSLVNPEREIQPFVVKLTGINNKMLCTAPKFYEIAKRIIEITEDCVIVAHNANFDYRILKTEFRRLGFEFKRETLCTVELTQKLMPDLESYSLGKLCRSLGLAVSNRHRAEGDALATVKLFKLLLEKDTSKSILKSIIKQGIEKELPEKLLTILDDLPTKCGVFYTQDKDANIIYIGEGRNIKKTVNKLFLKSSPKATKLQKSLVSVKYELTGSLLIARLKYVNEIHIHKPKFNTHYPKRAIHPASFSNPNMIIVDKGRHTSERSVIVIENNQLLGYCFVELQYQLNNHEILKEMLTPISGNGNNVHIIRSYLQKNSVEKIIRF